MINNARDKKIFIIDMDGTIYDQRKMRGYMFLELLINFWKVKDFWILYIFRKEREKMAGIAHSNLELYQYEATGKRLGMSADKIRKIVEEWILCRPIKYLNKCIFPGVADFLQKAKQHGKIVVCFSDYPLQRKVTALDIDFNGLFCATDRNISAFKPNKRGIEIILKEYNVLEKDCVIIGDREDREGEMARICGIDVILINKDNQRTLYSKLISQLIV